MKKTLLATLLAISFVGSASAANVPLSAFNTVTVGGPATSFGTLVLAGGQSASIGFELNVPGHVTGTSNVLVAPGFSNSVSFELFADADNNNLFDDAIDTFLASTGPLGVVSVPSTYVAGGQAFFARFTNNNQLNAVVGTNISAVSSVPLPAAAWLFGSALFGAGALRRKQAVAA